MDLFFYLKIYPSVFLWVMAVFLLVIGLRGLLTKRPFLISARWMFLVFTVIIVGPVMVTAILSPFLFLITHKFQSKLDAG